MTNAEIAVESPRIGARDVGIARGTRRRRAALAVAVWILILANAATIGAALATPGTYARGEHIRDPFTGRAPRGVLSVSVTAGDLSTADALATAAFAMGAAGIAWSARIADVETLTILADERVLHTPGFPLASASDGS